MGRTASTTGIYQQCTTHRTPADPHRKGSKRGGRRGDPPPQRDSLPPRTGQWQKTQGEEPTRKSEQEDASLKAQSGSCCVQSPGTPEIRAASMVQRDESAIDHILHHKTGDFSRVKARRKPIHHPRMYSPPRWGANIQDWRDCQAPPFLTEEEDEAAFCRL